MKEELTYIYQLECPIKHTIRYIEKSNEPLKRLDGHYSEKGNTKKCNWIKSLKKKGLKPIVEIVDQVLESEWEFWEQHYISLYKSWGFKLTNLTNGGEGVNKGTIPWNKNLKFPGTAWNLGKSPSKETKEKISKTLKGNKPWNTGTKGMKPSNSGSFIKGTIPHNKTKLDINKLKLLLEELKENKITQKFIKKELKIGYSTLIKYINLYKNGTCTFL